MSFLQQEMAMSSSAPSPCVKGCGYFGSPDTLNMCSVCYTRHLLHGTPAAAAAASREDHQPVVKTRAVEDDEAAAPAPAAALTDAEISRLQHEDWERRVRKAKENPYYSVRCARCYKKFKIGGRFECRCGKAYCINHRLSEDHYCGFDYQRAGVISTIRNNPLVEPDKLRDRI